MYKLKIEDKSFVVFKLKSEPKDSFDYYQLCRVKTSDTLKGIMSQQLLGLYKEEQIEEAINYMIKMNHNMAEFGPNGFFTVSYHTDELEV